MGKDYVWIVIVKNKTIYVDFSYILTDWCDKLNMWVQYDTLGPSTSELDIAVRTLFQKFK